jgi:geranylgeranyl diphosphate synthase, type II
VKSYESLLVLFNGRLDAYVGEIEKWEPRSLYQPQAYFISLGGKRLRPLLALIGCDLFGQPPHTALPSALAVELFHNFSLIHDDILDQAPVRRGQSTVHTKWNESTAILTGDALLVQSLRCLEEHKPPQYRKLATLLCRTAMHVCEGQQLDMSFETAEDVSVKEYIAMITGKTAVLLGCSLQMGAISAGAGRVAQEWLFEAGKKLGIAFQLTDDLLDAYAEEDSGFGKQKGGDILANKKTFLLLKARELAKPRQLDELTRLMKLEAGNESEKLNGVLSIFDQLRVREFCQKEADKYTVGAIAAFGKVKADNEKIENLKQLAYDLLSRKL